MSSIIILSHFKPYPPNHGFAHRVWHRALDLHKKGFSVTIIHNAIHGPNVKTDKEIEGVKIVQIPFLFKSFQKKHFIFQANPLLFLELMKNRADIVEIELCYLLPVAFLHRLLSKKIIYDAHGVEYEWQRLMYNRKGLILNLIKMSERAALKLCTDVICCSEADRSTFIREFGINNKKIKVVPSIVDTDSFKKITPHKFQKPTALFIGSSLHPANKEAIERIFYDILPRVASKVKDAQFCFIGKNPPSWLIGKNVLVLGEVIDVKPYIKGADVCIAPIFSGCGTRIKVLEYAAGGKKIIATSKAIEGLYVKHNKNIIIRETSTAFSEALSYSLNPIKK
jgi:glycosyltransferase involved in cell wall biosynthesis